MKKRLVWLIVFGASLIVLCSCQSIFPRIYIPEESVLRQIEEIDYDLENLNCTHKSILYHKSLKDKGIVSRIVGGYTGIEEVVLHAWVEVFKPDKKNPRFGIWFMIDPTWIEDDPDGFPVGNVKDGIEYMHYKYYPKRSRVYVYVDDISVITPWYHDIIWADFTLVQEDLVKFRKQTIIENRKRYKELNYKGQIRYPLFPRNWDPIDILEIKGGK